MAEKVNFDKHAESYEKQLTDDLKFFGEESSYFAEYKIRIVKEKLGFTPSNILEYGCGIGMNLRYMADYFPGSNVHGCDISAKSIEVASKRNPAVSFFLIEDKEIEMRKETFDLIFVSNVFHHIELPLRKKAISNINKMLKKTGKVFFFEHNPYNPVTRHIVNTCVWDTDAVLLKPKESLGLFRGAGLNVVSKVYTLYFPAFLKFLRPVEKMLWFLPMGGQYYIKAEKAE
ncbi:MAG: class I SAM-dependent methyltransferase [Bacteroidetes bacterium]|nr:class I SAM-dependent methyltransferase [Bacteroidota bacterium]